ncbi:uncharacterized protein JCM6883_000830 [Sporobolomyces salmoneus]|uniref:uncharacterized protein n=1 Tax=Sporobolomyces salmoneus TaxID=183962 RepID=UPI00317DA786
MRGRSNTILQPPFEIPTSTRELPATLPLDHTTNTIGERPGTRSIEDRDRLEIAGQSTTLDGAAAGATSQGSRIRSRRSNPESDNSQNETIPTAEGSEGFSSSTEAVYDRGAAEETEAENDAQKSQEDGKGSQMDQGTDETELRKMLHELIVQQAERDKRNLASYERGRRRKWLLICTPSKSYVQALNPGLAASSEFAEFGSSQESVFLPLQPTLPAQARLVAEEFSLSSINGISLYLCLPSPADTPLSPTPLSPRANPSEMSSPRLEVQTRPDSRIRFTESSWKVLWADYLQNGIDAKPMPGVNGLPIAGRIQFEIDSTPTRTRARPTPTTEPSENLRTSTSKRPRFASSEAYGRPLTPSWSESWRSESRSSSYSHTSVDPITSLDRSTSPTSFRPRPLHVSSLFRPSSSDWSTGLPPQAQTPPLSRSQSPPGSALETPRSTPSTPNETPPNPTPTLDRNNSFRKKIQAAAFPLPPSNVRQIEVGHEIEQMEEEDEEEETSLETEQSSLDWTYELNRLKELSETSMFKEVDTIELSSSVLATENVELSREEGGGENAIVDLNQSLSLPSPILPLSNTAPAKPTLTLGARYPFFQIYRPVYPVLLIYPPAFASKLSPLSLPQPCSVEAEEDTYLKRKESDVVELRESSSVSDESPDYEFHLEPQDESKLAVHSPAYSDPSVDWYHSSTPLELSPASSSCDEEDEESEEGSEGEGEEWSRARYEGTMLTTIPEESYTRSLTVQMEENDSIEEENQDELYLEEGIPYESDEPLSVDPSKVPVIVRTCPSVSESSDSDPIYSPLPIPSARPTALELRETFHPPSPLPSPTITPSTILPLGDPHETALTISDSDQFEYEFECEGEDDLPYLSTPGLREALGFDDSPELHPFPYDGSDCDSDEGREFALEEEDGEVEPGDDSCQTFDHLSPLPDSSANTIVADSSLS